MPVLHDEIREEPLEKYLFQFDSVFTNKEIGQAFYEHLKQECKIKLIKR